jgi:hypothetical protein
VSRLDLEQPVLRTAADVAQAKRAGRSRLPPPHTVLAVELAEDQASGFETRLNREADACGCGSAAVAASFAFFGYVVVVLLVVGTPPRWGFAELVWGGAVLLGAALVGKALGLMRARRRWFDELERLRAQLLLGGDG